MTVPYEQTGRGNESRNMDQGRIMKAFYFVLGYFIGRVTGWDSTFREITGNSVGGRAGRSEWEAYCSSRRRMRQALRQMAWQ